MRRAFAHTLLAGMPLLAHAFDGMTNPLGMMSPLGMMGGPMMMGGPFGPGAPVVGLGVMHPALQMAPNMMSYQHINQMTNPYLGGPFAGNPYLKPSLPLPFAPPAFAPGLPFGVGATPSGYQPASPYKLRYDPSASPAPSAVPTWPMPMPAGGARPAAAPFPFPMNAPAGATPAAASAKPFDPAMWFPFGRPPGQ